MKKVTKQKIEDILFDIFIVICIVASIYLFFFYNNVDDKDIVVSLQNEEDYPVYTGWNVYEYWKTTLNEEEKILYEDLKEAHLQFKERFATHAKEISIDDMKEVFNAVLLDHPEIF